MKPTLFLPYDGLQLESLLSSFCFPDVAFQWIPGVLHTHTHTHTEPTCAFQGPGSLYTDLGQYTLCLTPFQISHPISSQFGISEVPVKFHISACLLPDPHLNGLRWKSHTKKSPERFLLPKAESHLTYASF